ncbi:LOW QUALITY PROTEIN: hypothetical protein HID58_095512, partial [Brassica napus]
MEALAQGRTLGSLAYLPNAKLGSVLQECDIATMIKATIESLEGQLCSNEVMVRHELGQRISQTAMSDVLRERSYSLTKFPPVLRCINKEAMKQKERGVCGITRVEEEARLKVDAAANQQEKQTKEEVGLEVSVTPNGTSLRCKVGNMTHREMLQIQRSVSACYSQAAHVPNVYHSYIKRWCKETGVCEPVTGNVQGTELPEECDDDLLEKTKSLIKKSMMLCLEDMPEIERKPVKKLKKALKMVTKALGVLERTNRHKLA